MADEADTTPVTDAPAGDSAPVTDTVVTDTGPTADTFGWDDWDGKEDALPETIRPWATRFGSYYGKQSDLARQEADRVKSIYETLMEGREDPRVAEWQEKYNGEAKTRAELAEQHRQATAALEAQRAEFTKYVDGQANAKAEAFQAAHPWIFESPELQTLGASLLDEQFSADDLPVLLRMPEPLLEATRKVHQELVKTGARNAGGHAIKIARAEFKVPKPSPAAQKTAGATGPIPTTSIPTAPAPDMSLKDRKDLAIDRALRLAK